MKNFSFERITVKTRTAATSKNAINNEDKKKYIDYKIKSHKRIRMSKRGLTKVLAVICQGPHTRVFHRGAAQTQA
jgi:hypothetical protein